MKGLEAVDQMHICSTAVQVVGDVTRALEEQYAQFADETVTKLLATVKVPTHTHARALAQLTLCKHNLSDSLFNALC